MRQSDWYSFDDLGQKRSEAKRSEELSQLVERMQGRLHEGVARDCSNPNPRNLKNILIF